MRTKDETEKYIKLFIIRTERETGEKVIEFANMEMNKEDRDTGEKKLLMRNIMRIISAKSRTIDILRKNSMMNLKLIEKSSKNKKDPNPLASTLNLMNQKYPLSIQKSQAKAYELPTKYLMKGSKGNDFHTSGRVLCKKEAIDWWIEKSPIPSESAQEVIDILYEPCRREVAHYYDIKWKGSRIKWGPPVIERKMVPTNAPKEYIPRPLRSLAIKETLFKSMTIPSLAISSITRAKAEAIISANIEAKIPLAKQIRIILNSMDERMRVLPTIPGMPSGAYSFKHAFTHSNYVVDNVNPGELTKTSVFEDNLIIVIKATISAMKEGKILPNDVPSLWNVITISDKDVWSILKEVEIKGTFESKWADTIRGI